MHTVVENAFAEITGQENLYQKKGFDIPRILVMSGLPFSGKSYLANHILEAASKDIVLVKSDRIRPIVARHMGRDHPIYELEEHQHTFALGHELCKKGLEMGHPVIADATNLTNQYREWATGAGQTSESGTLIAFLSIDVSVAIDRAMMGAQNESQANPAVYKMLKKEWEPMSQCTTPYVVVESAGDISEISEMLAKWLCGEKSKVAGTITPTTGQNQEHL